MEIKIDTEDTGEAIVVLQFLRHLEIVSEKAISKINTMEKDITADTLDPALPKAMILDDAHTAFSEIVYSTIQQANANADHKVDSANEQTNTTELHSIADERVDRIFEHFTSHLLLKRLFYKSNKPGASEMLSTGIDIMISTIDEVLTLVKKIGYVMPWSDSDQREISRFSHLIREERYATESEINKSDGNPSNYLMGGRKFLAVVEQTFNEKVDAAKENYSTGKLARGAFSDFERGIHKRLVNLKDELDDNGDSAAKVEQVKGAEDASQRVHAIMEKFGYLN